MGKLQCPTLSLPSAAQRASGPDTFWAPTRSGVLNFFILCVAAASSAGEFSIPPASFDGTKTTDILSQIVIPQPPEPIIPIPIERPKDDIERCIDSQPPEFPNGPAPVPQPKQPPHHAGQVEPIPLSQWPKLSDDLDTPSALLALQRTEEYWTSMPPDRKIQIGEKTWTARHLLRGLQELEQVIRTNPSPSALRKRLAERFNLFETVSESGNPFGTITGYYTPEIGVLTAPDRDAVPIYAKPVDLVHVPPEAKLPFDYGHIDSSGDLIPYFSRREISEGAMEGLGLEMLWTRHPADLLVLQTEGSGWAIFPNGSKRLLSFDGTNGRPFRSVEQAMKGCGLVPPGTGSLKVIQFLKSQPPDREQRLVNLNPRYEFFKISDAIQLPQGASGIEVVDGRSIAVDTDLLPFGLPAFLVSKRPVADARGGIVQIRNFSRLVFTHDIGTAIRGPTRVDLYWGSGPKAEAEAYHMKFPGRLYVFVLK